MHFHQGRCCSVTGPAPRRLALIAHASQLDRHAHGMVTEEAAPR
jgi:hypothetical protein